MNECLNNEPNYITYYNSIQMCLPLGLGYEITPTDELLSFREFDSCLHFFTNQIAQNVDYINAFEFFYCQICENICTNMG